MNSSPKISLSFYKKIFFLLTISLPFGAFAQETNYKSYSLFVYNFTKYMEWPGDRSGDFVISVLGDSKIISELKNLASTKKVSGRPIIVKVVKDASELSDCHLLFISTAKSNQIKQVNEKFKGKPTLVVAERDGLTKKGAGVDFFMDEDESLKFGLNQKEVESHSIKVAGTLLKLAELVN